MRYLALIYTEEADPRRSLPEQRSATTAAYNDFGRDLRRPA